MPIINLKEERACKEGFLTHYLAYAQPQEAPDDFHTWVAIGLIGSTLARNCWLDRGFGKLYANLYIVLVGESALERKTVALQMGVNLLRRALSTDINFFAQKITPESFMNFLAKIYEKKKVSEAIIHASEFSVFLGKAKIDPAILALLTDLYDTPDIWDYSTIVRGNETCNNACINMLAGTTPEWLKLSLPEEAIGGGFYSRLLLIYRSGNKKRNPHPEDDLLTPEAQALFSSCENDLRIIRNMHGPFSWIKQAKQMYDDWYYEYNMPSEAPPYLRGYFGRKGSTIIKLAMISSASCEDSKKIRPTDIMWAINILEENELHLKGIVNFLGMTEEGKKAERVLYLIRKAGQISHSVLLQNVSHQLNRDELRLVLDTLLESKQIEKFYDGSKYYYKFVG